MHDDTPQAVPTRRRLMRGVGAAGLVAAVAAVETVGRAAPAQAGTDGDVVLGASNSTPSQTAIYCTSDAVALYVEADGTNGLTAGAAVIGSSKVSAAFGVVGTAQGGIGVDGEDGFGGTGVRGISGLTVPGPGPHGVHGVTDSSAGSGVLGENASGAAVSGISSTGNGVVGNSASGDGVQGFTNSSGSSGVYGDNTGGGKGVFGNSSSGNGVEGKSTSADGVYGNSSSGNGVEGSSASGNGVQGETSSNTASGVYGQNNGTGFGVAGRAAAAGGTGVLGDSASGVGVLASSANGTALKVTGRAAFSRSGLLTIPAGKTSAVHSGVALTAASLVLATLQQHVAGVYVQAAVPNVASSSFTVYLSKASTVSVTVAWFVVN